MRDAGQGRGARAARRVGAGLTVGLLLAGCATAAPQTLENLSAGEVQKIDQTCEQTLGAQPGGRYFASCRARLAEAARRQDARRLVLQTHADCARASSPEGSSQFSLCVLDARASAAQDPAARPRPLALASRAEVHHRAELSCANLGLDPDAGDFSDCVTELEVAILPPDDPSN